jgi:hypothetical protein
MDRIQFEVRPYRQGQRDGGVRVFINGRDLSALAGRVEAPFAEAEGSPSIAGAYSGLPPTSDVCWPSQHFLGRPVAPLYQYGEKVQVLGCECGEPGCWPLVCRIEERGSHVIWRDFEQPHRTESKGHSPWRYDALGPFEFERAAYEQAVRNLRQAG